MSYDSILEATETSMLSAIEHMDNDFAKFRTGKASTSLVEDITVDYYGTPTRLKELAGISTPEPRLIAIQPWDASIISLVEKAIQVAELGISPVNDGKIIRLNLPELSEERRKDLAKQVKKRTEEAKIAVRNIRRDGNDQGKKAEKGGEMTEDDLRDLLDEIQKLTDKYIKEVDAKCHAKEKDLLNI
jgi:ribosome recycling factor